MTHRLDGADCILLFVTLGGWRARDAAMAARIKQAIRDSATARHVPARVIQVPDIPRSMNGKPSEVAVRDAIQGRAPTNLSGLVDPGALEFVRALPGVNA